MPDQQHTANYHPSLFFVKLYFTCKFLISRPTNRGLFTVVHICQLLLHNTTYEFDSLGLVACHAASSSVYLLTFRGFNLAMKTPSNHTPPRDGINYILTSLGFVHVVRFVSVRPSRRRIQSATQPAANSSLIRRFKFGSWWLGAVDVEALEAKRKMF